MSALCRLPIGSAHLVLKNSGFRHSLWRLEIGRISAFPLFYEHERQFMSDKSKPSENPVVVKAIDVGFGTIKYTAIDIDGKVQCGIFPSLAPAAAGGAELSSGLLQKRNTVVVEVDGVRYEVGKDARLAVGAHFGRVLANDYAKSAAHIALIRGALYYMGATEIDLLVLGLPLNTFERYRDELETKVAGVHPVPFKGEVKTCTIKKVRVLPQPVGALFEFCGNNGTYMKMRSQTNLIVDVGFYTLDWVVADGMKMNEARSGATTGGMSAALKVIAKGVGETLAVDTPSIERIDEALRKGIHPEFFGKEYDLKNEIRAAKVQVDQDVAIMLSKIGESSDISNIVLTGGGAEFFRSSIEKAFPRHEIVTTGESVFANVRGFYRAGQQFARNNR